MRKGLIFVLCIVMFASFCACSGLDPVKNESTDTKSIQTSVKEGPEAPTTTNSEGKKETITLYFANKDNSAVLTEKRDITVKGGAVMKTAIEALLEGPENSNLRKTIPDGTKVLGVNRKGNVAIVDFSKEYTSANDIAEIVERASVVNTLTEIPGIEKVKIMVGGKDLIGPSGMPFGELSRFYLDEKGQPVAGDKKTVMLYFGNSNADALIAEKRIVNVSKGEALEKAIFEELKKGPKGKGLYPVIPEGTKLLSVKTQSGICRLNLSGEFVSNNHTGTAGEDMTVYSIVNSLTELPGIAKVQFLIDGQVREAYIHLAFDEPFSKNQNIVKK